MRRKIRKGRGGREGEGISIDKTNKFCSFFLFLTSSVVGVAVVAVGVTVKIIIIIILKKSKFDFM